MTEKTGVKTGKKGARQASFDVLNRVSGGAYADILLEGALKGLNEADRALATELTYGVLRWQIRLDWTLDLFSDIKTKKLETRVLNALRLGVYQIYFLTKIPVPAAINESVGLIRPGGRAKAGFVNAVLRSAASDRGRVVFPDLGKDPVRHISVAYSHPEWIVRRWIKRYGTEKTMGLCRADQTIPPKLLRANTLKYSREELIERLSGEGIEARQATYSPFGVEVISGRPRPDDPGYYIQDEASQLVALLLSPRPGQTVLDACSAPGGKTTEMAEMMEDRGRIIALDKYETRLKRVKEAAKRLGATIIETMHADAGEPLPEGLPQFDAILCDAPCSGLGVLMRSPDIKLRRQEGDITDLAKRQSGILDNVSLGLKKGGVLVYSVCTLEPEETEEVINGFLDKHRDFVLEGAADLIPREWGMADEKGFFRTDPESHGMEGFFAARLKRV